MQNSKVFRITLILIITCTLFLFFLTLLNFYFKGPNINYSFFNKYGSYQDILRYLNNNYNNDFKIKEELNGDIIYQCRENKKIVVSINLDKNFFKNYDYEYDYAKDILVGDSFLFGKCVDNKFSIKENLKKNLKRNFLEFSQSNTTIDLQTFYIKKYLQNKNFENLYIFFYENNDLVLVNKDFEKYDYDRVSNMKALKKNNAQNINKEIKTYKEDFIKIKNDTNINYKLSLFLSKKLKGISSFVNHFKFKNRSIDDEIIKKYFKFILREKIFFKKNIYIIYMPTWERFQYPIWHNKNKYYDSIFNKMKIYSNNNNIDLIDCRQAINKKSFSAENLYSHYNELGYKNLSNCLINKLNIF